MTLKLGQEGREVAIGHSDVAELLPCSTTRVVVAKVQVQNVKETFQIGEFEVTVKVDIRPDDFLCLTDEEEVEVRDLLILSGSAFRVPSDFELALADKTIEGGGVSGECSGSGMICE